MAWFSKLRIWRCHGSETWVAAVVKVLSLDQEFSHAVGTAKKKKKKKKKLDSFDQKEEEKMI